jgi:hypothetical protein
LPRCCYGGAKEASCACLQRLRERIKVVRRRLGQIRLAIGRAARLRSPVAQEGLVFVEKNGKFGIYAIADKRLGNLLKTIEKEYCGA